MKSKLQKKKQNLANKNINNSKNNQQNNNSKKKKWIKWTKNQICKNKANLNNPNNN